MIFHDTPLADARVIELEKRGDERGFFARAWCEREFREAGLSTGIEQANVSRSSEKGTLRGMHYQLPPAAEVKLVRCTRGAVHDVILDLRPGSPTRGEWFGADLTEGDHNMLYVPEGFAHGFQTLEPDSEVFYLVSASYAPDLERGVRWNDPAFGIEWPLEPTVMSDKDRSWPDYEEPAELRAVARP